MGVQWVFRFPAFLIRLVNIFVRNFGILSNLIWEGLKNPKDNPCWKGYHPVGTKKKNGKTVPNCVPKEAYDPWDEFDVMYIYDATQGRLMKRNVYHAELRNARAQGYSETIDQALKRVGIFKSKYDPNKYIRKDPAGKWVQVFPFGKPEGVAEDVKKKLTEHYSVQSSFASLPDNPPHGFWVTKGGQFIVIPGIFGHDEAINALYPNVAAGKIGSQLQMNALKAGFIRMAKLGGSTYGLTYHPMYSSSSAKKAAKDIAAFYNMGVQDDFEGL